MAPMETSDKKEAKRTVASVIRMRKVEGKGVGKGDILQYNFHSTAENHNSESYIGFIQIRTGNLLDCLGS